MTNPTDPFDALVAELEGDPEKARNVAHDLAAIADGTPPTGNYNLTQWWRIRRALAQIEPDELERTLGTRGNGLHPNP